MIHTNTLTTALSGLNLDIEPKEMIRPKGSANTSVNANMAQVIPNPSSKFKVTCQKVIIYLFL